MERWNHYREKSRKKDRRTVRKWIGVGRPVREKVCPGNFLLSIADLFKRSSRVHHSSALMPYRNHSAVIRIQALRVITYAKATR